MAAKTVIATAVVTVAFLVSGLLDPVQLLVAGDTGPSVEVVRRDFPGHELVDGIGHDGQQTYAIAAELPDLHAAAEHLDSPRYRLLRILAPFVASVAPRGDATVLLLLALNVLGLGLAVGGLASLCEQSGRRATLGWLALVPIILPAFMTVVDPLATGLTLTALALLLLGRFSLASVVFALGCLTREGVAVTVAATAVVVLFERRSLRGHAVIGLAVLPLAAWYLYLAREIGGSMPDRWSFLAFLHMPASTTALVIACLALGAAGAWGWRARPVVAAAAATQAVQIPFFFEDIDLPLNLTRVVAVALALGLVVVVDRLPAVRFPPRRAIR
jgi:hypothetical protein